MLDELRFMGVRNESVLQAIACTPRESFLPPAQSHLAYINRALAIDSGQTISQPYVVAKMSELLMGEDKLEKVLEVGTGSAYQAAILSHLVKHVYTVERIERLYIQAKTRLQDPAYANVHSLYGDGYLG